MAVSQYYKNRKAVSRLSRAADDDFFESAKKGGSGDPGDYRQDPFQIMKEEGFRERNGPDFVQRGRELRKTIKGVTPAHSALRGYEERRKNDEFFAEARRRKGKGDSGVKKWKDKAGNTMESSKAGAVYAEDSVDGEGRVAKKGERARQYDIQAEDFNPRKQEEKAVAQPKLDTSSLTRFEGSPEERGTVQEIAKKYKK